MTRCHTKRKKRAPAKVSQSVLHCKSNKICKDNLVLMWCVRKCGDLIPFSTFHDSCSHSSGFIRKTDGQCDLACLLFSSLFSVRDIYFDFSFCAFAGRAGLYHQTHTSNSCSGYSTLASAFKSIWSRWLLFISKLSFFVLFCLFAELSSADCSDGSLHSTGSWLLTSQETDQRLRQSWIHQSR